MPRIALIRYRQDLRVADHAPLLAALEEGYLPVPVFIHNPAPDCIHETGHASRRWLHDALLDLDGQLQALGSRLIIRSGDEERELTRLLAETGAQAVYWHRIYEPRPLAADLRLTQMWQAQGLDIREFAGDCLHDPAALRNKTGKPYQVFTPFWRHCLTLPTRPPAPAPDRLPAPPADLASHAPASLGLIPSTRWDEGISRSWDMTRAGGLARLRTFLTAPSAVAPAPTTAVDNYETHRDVPSIDGTSRLSPYLHFGQLSVHEAYHRGARTASPGRARFLSELGWREFGRHLLYHFPHSAEHPLDESFSTFPWATDAALLQSWQRGLTGVPIVDAGMRQLWQTGWMHNRVRMIAGSYLVKNLLLDWRLGASWFNDTLVDADLAQNTMGWQWVAGCGADAAPYFRVFNPVLQGARFDPAGDYVRQFVPELRQVPNKWIHNPWEAPAPVAAMIGGGYPGPAIAPALARARALAAYATTRGRSA